MIEDVMGRLKEVNFPCAPISDRASTFGFNRWSKLAAKNGLKPIFGVELAVSPDISAKKPIVDHWSFFAIDDIARVNELVFLATSQFRFEPLLSYEQANAAQGVIKVIGNRSMLPQVQNDDRTFVALSPSTSKGLYAEAKKLGFKFIASSDNKFVREGDKGFYEVLVGKFAATQTYPQYILGFKQWQQSVRNIERPPEILEAWNNFEDVWKHCNATLKKGNLLSPPHDKSLRQMCLDGAAKLGVTLDPETYGPRLDRELALIAEKKFEDYFFIIADLMQWARPRLLCGPARGSSCGSLVCYLTEITTVDPIKWGLIFERFVDISRLDLPDIDLDASDQNRDMMFAYLEEKYGKEHVARLGTVALYRPKSAIDESGAALGIPPWKTAKAMDALIVRSSGDSRALNTLEDTLRSTPNGKALIEEFPEVLVAVKMEGHPRHNSQHAAGVVITEKPTLDYVAVDARTGATHCDKKDAEDLNLLKIDLLGLTQLSVFEDALSMAGLDLNHLDGVDLNEPEVFEILNKKQFSGIFQFNGPALQSICNQIKIEKIDDIVAVTSLARPGPMASGGTNEWIKRKNGKPIEYPHPVFEPYLKETLGMVTYQEQILVMCKEIGNMTWEDCTALRKAMSKSYGKEFFDQYGDQFKAGAVEKGIPREVLDRIWDDLCLSGDTIIENPFPSKGSYKFMTLKQLYERGGLGPTEKKAAKRRRQSILMWDGKKLVPAMNWGVTYSGKKMTYELKTKEGNKIRATLDHKFLQKNGSYIQLSEIQKLLKANKKPHVMSDAGVIPSGVRVPKRTGSGGHNWWWKLREGVPTYAAGKRWLKAFHEKCQRCKKAPYQHTHHIDFDPENNRIDNLMALCVSCHRKIHAAAGSGIPWKNGRAIFADEVIGIKPYKEEDVYDVRMPTPHHNFLASSIVVHNCAYGAYCFNKSHSVAYGLLSYWCCWLKAHHPFEFAAATLSHESDPAKQIKILREMADEGIAYVAFDKDLSTDKWTAGTKDGNKILVGPLQNVKGLGPKMVQQVMGARLRGEPLPARFEKIAAEARTELDSLHPIRDAVKRLMPDPAEKNIFTPATKIIDVNVNGTEQSALVFAVAMQIKPRDENEQINIAKRNGKILTGPTQSLNLTIADDTDRIFAKVNRFDYEKLGRAIVERGRPGKALYAIKGTIPKEFRMISVKNIRFIGFLDDN